MARPRVLVSTDAGYHSETDDLQTLAELLALLGEIRLEGLVSSWPSTRGAVAILEMVEAYEKDYPKLRTWGEYPTPAVVRAMVKQGARSAAPTKGWSSATDGSRLIVEQARAGSAADPLWILVWGSMTDLAQALHDAPDIVPLIRVYSLGDWNTKMDRPSRDYVHANFKSLWWIECETTMRGICDGADPKHPNGTWSNDPPTIVNLFRMDQVRGHGALGEARYQALPWANKDGDAASLFYVLHPDRDNPASPANWGGQFFRPEPAVRPNFWTDMKDPALAVGKLPGARTIARHQATIYQMIYAAFDRCQAAKAGSPQPNPEPQPQEPVPTTPSGGDTPMAEAVTDKGWSVAHGQTHWFNTKYLLLNDKGAPPLKMVGVAPASKYGVPVSWDAATGTAVYTAPADRFGVDEILYEIEDANGVRDAGIVNMTVTGGTKPLGQVSPPPSPDEPDPEEPPAEPPAEEPPVEPPPVVEPQPTQPQTLQGAAIFQNFIRSTEGQNQSPALQRALQWSELNDVPVMAVPDRFILAQPVHLATTRQHHGQQFGLFANGSYFQSRVEGGRDVVTIEARHYSRGFRWHDMTIKGNSKKDGNGLVLTGRLPGQSGSLYNANVRNIVIEGVGKNGLKVWGEVFEASMLESYFRDNGENGALFSHGDGGRGIMSAFHMGHCVFGGNGESGWKVAGGATHVAAHRCYSLHNKKFGAEYVFGPSDGNDLDECAFENNGDGLGSLVGAHVRAQVRIGMTGCHGSVSSGGSKYLLDLYATTDSTLFNCAMSGRDAAKGKTRLVRLSGTEQGFLEMIGCDESVDVVGAARYGIIRAPRAA